MFQSAHPLLVEERQILIGSQYLSFFDMTYEQKSLGEAQVVLHLVKCHRVCTTLAVEPAERCEDDDVESDIT